MKGTHSMAENSTIEWTDHTWSPWIGCTKVSPACDGCYAEHLMDTRLGRVEWGPHGERSRTSAALPGSGPSGESCGSCGHLVRREMARVYLKCGLMRAHWTRGPGSDIRARAPACRNWKMLSEEGSAHA